MKRVKITAERVQGKDLQAGDLFSTVGELYWNLAMDKGSIGEKLYVRTNASAMSAPDPELYVYRIFIEIVDEQ